jgi:polyphosphate kinase 2
MTVKKTRPAKKPAPAKKTTATIVKTATTSKTKATPKTAAKTTKATVKKTTQAKPDTKNKKPQLKAPKAKNPKIIRFKNKGVVLKDLLKEYGQLSNNCQKLSKYQKKAIRRYHREEALKPYQAELIRMQKCLERTGRKMIILFEGRDAAGKGGTIRRVTRYMNEKHYRVVAMAKPTEHEKTQWYFQKYAAQLPRGGEVVLFDRSWYNRAVVEPVFGFCTPEEYKNFMRGVIGFEKDLVRQGTILVKLYFSVTKQEQAKRFKRRKTDPLRQWKLSEIDVQAQDRWDDFTTQKYEMMKKTHTNIAPWTIIRSNNKHEARLNSMKIILNSVPYERGRKDLDFVPDPEIVISGSREKEIMDAQRIKLGSFVG